MREWMILAVGGSIGLAIGIVIGDTFVLPHVVGKVLALAGGTFGACAALGLATKAGWIEDVFHGA
jgi:hypothetical protein